MPAYDPKRPRPADLIDAPAPVDSLLDRADSSPGPPVVDVTGPMPEPLDDAADERVTLGTEPEPVHLAGRSPEVPVAPAPQVGTANRAVLVASVGVSTAVLAVLVWLRLRRRASRSAA
jgi:hypothetical protein